MVNGKYHTEIGNVIIDAALTGHVYEVMVMYKSNGRELDVGYTTSEEEAARLFDEYVKKYDVLKGKYARLRDDLKKGVLAATNAVEGIPDEGTCNMDDVWIHLPRWQTAKVKRALAEAGAYGYKSTVDNGWYISPGRFGQARRNTRAVVAMRDSLKENGYEVGVRYCMD